MKTQILPTRSVKKVVLFLHVIGLLFVTGCLFNGKGDLKTAQLALEGKDYNQAIRYATRALKFGSLETKDQSEAHECRGKANLQKRQLDRALVDFDTMLTLNPNYSFGFMTRSEAHMLRKEFGKALTDANTCLDLIDPKTEPAGLVARRHIHRAKVYLLQKDAENAERDINKAFEFAPEFDEAFYLRSYVKQIHKDLVGALADAEKAQSLLEKNRGVLSYDPVSKKARGFQRRVIELRLANGVDPLKASSTTAEAPGTQAEADPDSGADTSLLSP
jgi:tetratricopeptide (TPR) repeat protein